MKGFFHYIILLSLFVTKCSGYSIITPRVSWSRLFLTGNTDSFERWLNPDYTPDELKGWYNSIDKSLLTVGSKGIAPSHINSLAELLNSHERVRVKIASDKMNIIEISKVFIEDPLLQGKAELLEIRKREFMIGRKIAK